MARSSRMPVAVLLALTLGPAIAIAATLWFVTDLIPQCVITENQRLTSPDGQYDLVIFSRDCGNTEANSQAALVPAGQEVPFDAASFASIGTNEPMRARWDAYDNIELHIPVDSEIYRLDENVAGINTVYLSD